MRKVFVYFAILFGSYFIIKYPLLILYLFDFLFDLTFLLLLLTDHVESHGLLIPQEEKFPLIVPSIYLSFLSLLTFITSEQFLHGTVHSPVYPASKPEQPKIYSTTYLHNTVSYWCLIHPASV